MFAMLGDPRFNLTFLCPYVFHHGVLKRVEHTHCLQPLPTYDATRADVHFWELGNVPIAPGFYDGDQDVQLDIMILPLVQVTDPDSKTSNLFDPFLPKVPQWCPRLKFSTPKKPRVLLPAFLQKRKRSQTGDGRDICEHLWSRKTASLKHHHREIENGASGYSGLEKEAIVKELARREKDGEGH
ncbi:hypothetical protein N7471_003316 [Penicillium samsonianum]|uniref:uncharacterized protein n=1 Tax=Penicillium samsonianum TaxID=1882272 RepID=UPI0025480648|nr:uncharacterized protein N7471_003316 [Penicillium samsonianum]KAJ6143863.1 hypothetical protein N7471_003316 [Penicillium samsonianum]